MIPPHNEVLVRYYLFYIFVVSKNVEVFFEHQLWRCLSRGLNWSIISGSIRWMTDILPPPSPSLIHSFARSLPPPFPHSFIHWPTHPFTQSHAHPPSHPRTKSITHSSNHTHTHSLSHPHALSHTHSLTLSLRLPYCYFVPPAMMGEQYTRMAPNKSMLLI